jgi:Na+/glutamate symporter
VLHRETRRWFQMAICSGDIALTLGWSPITVLEVSEIDDRLGPFFLSSAIPRDRIVIRGGVIDLL